MSGEPFIINLDSIGGAGTHWTTCRLVGDVLYYADPFGLTLNGWPPAELDGLGSYQIINRISFQRPSTELCGYYAICFANAMRSIDRMLSVEQFEKLLYNSLR